MDQNILSQCQAMLHQSLSMGGVPVVYVMGPATHQQITELAAANTRDRQSILQKLLFRARKKRLTLQVLYGVPVVENQFMPDGMVSLQLAPTPEQVRQATQIGQGAPMSEFVDREPLSIKEAPAGGSEGPALTAPAPTLNDLAQNSASGPTPTDILIKAMDRVDALRNVIVIRVFRNGDIDLCTDCNQFEAPGVLQKAQAWLFMRGQ